MAELHGHWGERFDRPLFALMRFYGNAFLLGERQYGLPILRALNDEYGYNWLWHERDFKTKGKRLKDALGWPKTGKRARDPLLRGFRLGIRNKDIWIRSEAMLGQLGSLQFASATKKEPEELVDDDLDIKIQGGGSPDLIMSGMYAYHALSEMPKFEKPDMEYEPGTLGEILGHAALEAEPDHKLYYVPSPTKKRRARRRH